MEKKGFKHHITALKARYYRLMSVKAMLFSLVFFSGVVMIITGLNRLTDVGSGIKIISGIAGIVSFAAGSITAYSVTPSFMNELILADKRLGLRDLFSTAYECIQTEKAGGYVAALISQAAQAMESNPHKIILPFKLPRMVYLVFLFSGISLGCYFYPAVHTRTEPKIRLNPEIEALSHQLETFANQTAEKQTRKEPDSMSRQIQQTSRQMLDSTRSMKEVAKSLSGLLDVVEKENSKTLEQLEDELALDGDGLGIPSQQPGENTGRAESEIRIELEDLKEKVDDAFGDEVPEALAEQLKELENNADFQDFLKNAIDRLDDDFREISDSSGDTGDGSSESREQESRKSAAGSDTGDRKDGMEDEASQRYYAGQKKSDAREQEPSAIETGDSPIVKDAIGSYETGALKYSIRALSVPGLSSRTEEDIKRQYQRQNEAVLVKEKIPAEYRELIRDYFLSIGFEKE